MKTTIQIIEDLPRRHASILIQLRTGHCPLNHYLYRFNCDACHEAPETVEHFILECRAHDRHRREMRKTTGTTPEALSKLLSDADAVRVLFRYINSTRRFERPYGPDRTHWREKAEEKDEEARQRIGDRHLEHEENEIHILITLI
ncbi:hypothetical protein J132_07933 [Termitomyces sp. J132]|nr:hypothetical protein J132_07933 [Termitomyces sp. J132]